VISLVNRTGAMRCLRDLPLRVSKKLLLAKQLPKSLDFAHLPLTCVDLVAILYTP
jgi:hypothetical protein